jgi:uncharacterized protein (DUF983 family)
MDDVALRTQSDEAIASPPNEKSILTGLRRGLARRCPNCGVGRLFDGFLTIRSPCDVCGNDNSIYPSDDFPPYLAIFITGHVVIPLFIWTDADFQPPFWLEAAIWLPLTAIMCTVLLPFMKGATVGLCWATNLVRREGTN